MSAQNEKPVIFSTPMVRAILDSSKTQTRRVIKPQPFNKRLKPILLGQSSWLWAVDGRTDLTEGRLFYCPYGQVGDRLWVKETFCVLAGDDERGDPILYKSNPEEETYMAELKADGHKVQWHSSLFMPRWASRITLEITEVRVERLQEITVQGAMEEGCCSIYAVLDFKLLWDSLNAKRGYGWDTNCWVWVISFRRVE